MSYPTSGAPSNITFDDCAIVSNTASQENGGGFAIQACMLRGYSSQLSHNHAKQYGGALFADSANITLQHVRVTHNSAMFGAGVRTEAYTAASMRVACCDISHNGGSSTIDGAGISVQNGSITLRDTNMSRNVASNAGAGMHVDHAGITMTGCMLLDNRATYGMGGAMHVLHSRGAVSHSELSRNQVSEQTGLWACGWHACQPLPLLQA